MKRRELIQIASASLALPLHALEPTKFFTVEEYALLDHLCEMILPSDADSPGARQAGVRRYIDITVFHSGAETQQRWRDGLAAIQSLAWNRESKDFLALTKQQQEAILALLAGRESNPGSDAEHFFLALKRMTIEGFFLSETGQREWLGHRQHTFTKFAGCAHTDHLVKP